MYSVVKQSIPELWIQQSVDELTASLCPYQVHFCQHHAVLQDTLMRAALGKTLAGKLGIKHVLSALPVLDAHLAKSAVQLLGGHAQLLGQLRGGDAGHGVQHLVGIVRLGLQTGNFFLASLKRGPHNFQRTCHDVLLALARLHHQVTALLADARKHLAGYPMLESLGAIELRGKDEGIEAGLVDEDGKLLTSTIIEESVFYGAPCPSPTPGVYSNSCPLSW